MFVINKRSLIIVSVLMSCVFTAILCFSAIKNNATGKLNSNGVKIVLDAGHGGVDGGVSGINTRVKESDLNLIVVNKLNKLLSDAGFNVVLTRNSEAGLYGIATKHLKKKDMKKRKEIILKANPTLVVSIHMNKYSNPKRRGAQVFFKDGDEQGKILAQSIQNSFNSMEKATRECSILKGDYYILNCSKYPSVICECGFLSNPEDEALLITDEYQNEITYSLFKGIVNYLVEESFVF